MDYFGINSAEDLPKISEVMMEELVKATNVQEAEENMDKVIITEETVETTITEEIVLDETVTEENMAEEDEITEEDDTVLAVTENGDIIEEDNPDKEPEA